MVTEEVEVEEVVVEVDEVGEEEVKIIVRRKKAMFKT